MTSVPEDPPSTPPTSLSNNGVSFCRGQLTSAEVEGSTVLPFSRNRGEQSDKDKSDGGLGCTPHAFLATPGVGT